MTTAIGSRETQFRSIGAAGLPLAAATGSGKGLIDPFAEIFARMAASSSKINEEPAASTSSDDRYADGSRADKADDAADTPSNEKSGSSDGEKQSAATKRNVAAEQQTASDILQRPEKRLATDPELNTDGINAVADASQQSANGDRNATDHPDLAPKNSDIQNRETDEDGSATGNAAAALAEFQAGKNQNDRSRDETQSGRQPGTSGEAEELSLQPEKQDQERQQADKTSQQTRRGYPIPVDGQVPEGAAALTHSVEPPTEELADKPSGQPAELGAEDSSTDQEPKPADPREVSRRRYSNRPDARSGGRLPNDPNQAASADQKPDSGRQQLMHALESHAETNAATSSQSSGMQNSDAAVIRPASAANAVAIGGTAVAAGETTTNAQSSNQHASSSQHAAGSRSGGATGANTASANQTSLGSNPATVGMTDAASHSSGSGSANQTDRSEALSALQRAKLVQRVSRGFQHIGREGGQIRLRLSPDHLGSVALDLEVQSGRLKGQVVTQTEAASRLIQEHLPELRSKLDAQGIKLESLEVRTESEAERSFDARHSGHQSSGQQEGRPDSRDPLQHWSSNVRQHRLRPEKQTLPQDDLSRPASWKDGVSRDHVDLRI